MSNIPSVRFEDILDKYKFNIDLFVPVTDKKYLDFLNEEKKAFGLDYEDISLLIPEDPKYRTKYGLARCEKASKGYNIILYPQAIDDDPLASREFAIRHELVHIKMGDCNLQSNNILHRLYYFFIAEHRTNFYVLIRTIKSDLENLFHKRRD